MTLSWRMRIEDKLIRVVSNKTLEEMLAKEQYHLASREYDAYNRDEMESSKPIKMLIKTIFQNSTQPS